MRIPLSWLKEYISLTQSPEEIAKLLTMAGLEVENLTTIGENLKNIVVAKVLTAEKHPNADKLTLATVTDGKETYQIVCGAPNCRAGLYTALAPIGATLTFGDEKLTIKKTKIRGTESYGMLCSEKDLGLSDSHEAILELSEDYSLGSSLAEIYADTYFDIALTPNLSHCSSILGVARELSALTGQPLQLPKIEVKSGNTATKDTLHIQVIDQEGCPRYACRVINHVKIKPSPNWLKNRLEKCGVRSVNNVVDATNYVLLEMGHPLHAFDYNKIKNQTIVIRKAQVGETIETLDGKVRTLNDSVVLISDPEAPLAIAGVMGGLDSEIQEHTDQVILEAAYFDPASIRKTSKFLGLQTDASKRFERGTDPNQVLMSLDRVAMIIQQIAGGEVQEGILDFKAKEFKEWLVPCRLNRVNQVLGLLLSRGEVEECFKRLQFSYQWDGQDQFLVQIPTYRNDIKYEIDLIEEVARLYGYENIPRKGGSYRASTLASVPIHLFEKEVRLRLIGEGLQEFLTCDLIGPTLMQIVQDRSPFSKAVIQVLNPTSVEQSSLRTSLLPGLLQVVKHNFDHQNRDVAGFEIGRVHFKEAEKYSEQPVVGIILTGKATPSHWERKALDYDFFDVKGIVENLLDVWRIENFDYKNLGLETFHTGRQASLFVGASEIGSFGEIHPSVQRRLDFPQRIYFAEFNLKQILALIKPVEKVQPLPIYPASERDWTLTVKKNVPSSRIIDLLTREKSSILEQVTLKDVYTSEKLGPDVQNVTLHFVYRDSQKTIEQHLVEAEHQRLISLISKELAI